MNNVVMGRPQPRPHYARLMAIGSAIAMLLFLLMPFASGPLGVSFNGWAMLGQTRPIMMLAIVGGVLFGLLGTYLLTTLCGVLAMCLLMRAASHVDQTASQMVASAQSLDTVGGAATYLMANQIGLQWGAVLVFLAAGGLASSLLFYRRP